MYTARPSRMCTQEDIDDSRILIYHSSMEQDSDSERIKWFLKVFANRVDFVRDKCLPHFPFEGRLLMCCYLDSLAGYRFPGKRNRERFRDFTLEYSELEEWRRISLPHLAAVLRRDGVIQDKHSAWVSSLESNFVAQAQLSNDTDTPERELKERFFDHTGETWPSTWDSALDKSMYVSILWDQYRNMAVHEGRPPLGDTDNILNKATPYYILLSNRRSLQIPVEFILTTLVNCLGTFEQWVRENEPEFISELDWRLNSPSS
jgi:hypothetical protein